MQKDPSEIVNGSSSSGKNTEAKAVASPQNDKAFVWPPSPWRPLTNLRSPPRTRSRSRSRSRTRDLASSQAHSESADDVEALKGRLQFDIKQAMSWKHGLTSRLDGQNRKLDAAFATANEGVKLATQAEVHAGDAMTRADDAMKHAEDALRRAKNVFNTAVNEHGPSLRKIKDRVTSLENKVEELDRDTRAMSRTLISGGSSAAASGPGEISDLRSDMRRLQRDADDLYATTRSSDIRIDGAEAAHNALKAQVEALAKELAAEKAKVAYLVHRDYASSVAQPQAQQQPQQQQQQPAYPHYAAYAAHSYPLPPAAATASTPAGQPSRVA